MKISFSSSVRWCFHREASQSGVFEEEAEPPLQDAQEEYAEKFMIGSQLADVKIAANLLREIERYNFINEVASEHSVDSLQSLLAENQTMYESMSSKVAESRQKEASRSEQLMIPRAVPGLPATDSKPDPLSIVLGGL
jgi:hypothetical protein